MEKSHNYAKLANKTLEDLELGASGRTDEETARKENPVDFALWKAAKPGEVSWDSPWGPGRPGWHIECSVMSTGILGDTIDIHGGGADLEFPHHTNEIAQSEAKTGKTFANYWMHNGFVNIDNVKMSKSLGNFITVHDALKTIDGQVLRFFFATQHYRKPINFTEKSGARCGDQPQVFEKIPMSNRSQEKWIQQTCKALWTSLSRRWMKISMQRTELLSSLN